MKRYRGLFLIMMLCATLSACGKKESSSPGAEIGDDIEASLKKFESRKRYSSFTADILRSIPDDRLEIAIIDYIADVKLKGNYGEEYRIIKGMNKGFRYIYITWNLEEEVENGGFIQYFYNSSGIFAGDLIEALHNIKAYKTEKIAGEAIALYNKERPLHDRIKKESSMKSFMSSYGESELEELDELFYNSGENLSQLRIRYIRDNSDQFITE